MSVTETFPPAAVLLVTTSWQAPHDIFKHLIPSSYLFHKSRLWNQERFKKKNNIIARKLGPDPANPYWQEQSLLTWALKPIALFEWVRAHGWTVIIKGACRIGLIINCTVLAINTCITGLGGKKGCLMVISGKFDKYRGACGKTARALVCHSKPWKENTNPSLCIPGYMCSVII